MILWIFSAHSVNFDVCAAAHQIGTWPSLCSETLRGTRSGLLENPQLTTCYLLSRCLKAHLNFKPFLKQGCVHYPINHSRLLSALSLWCSVSGCPPRDLPPRWDTVPLTVPLKYELLFTPSMFFMVTILRFYIMTLQGVNRGRISRGCRFACSTGTFW